MGLADFTQLLEHILWMPHWNSQHFHALLLCWEGKVPFPHNRTGVGQSRRLDDAFALIWELSTPVPDLRHAEMNLNVRMGPQCLSQNLEYWCRSRQRAHHVCRREMRTFFLPTSTNSGPRPVRGVAQPRRVRASVGRPVPHPLPA